MTDLKGYITQADRVATGLVLRKGNQLVFAVSKFWDSNLLAQILQAERKEEVLSLFSGGLNA